VCLKIGYIPQNNPVKWENDHNPLDFEVLVVPYFRQNHLVNLSLVGIVFSPEVRNLVFVQVNMIYTCHRCPYIYIYIILDLLGKPSCQLDITHLHLLLNIGISSCQVKDQRVPEINCWVILGTDEHLDIVFQLGFIAFEPFNMLVHTFRRSLQHGSRERWSQGTSARSPGLCKFEGPF